MKELLYVGLAVIVYSTACATTRCEAPKTVSTANPYPMQHACYQAFENNRRELKEVYGRAKGASDDIDELVK